MSNISDKAVISPKAKIGQNVTIYPFVYIEDDVVVGDNCVIYPNVNLMNGTRLGSGNLIHQNTVISAIPQDFHYKGGKTLCVIGNNNIIRENVVINRATYESGETRIGNSNFLMEGVHLSHDVHVGNDNVFGYGTKVAGDCEIASYNIFASGIIISPNVRIGDCTIVESGAFIEKDVPPYIVAGDYPIRYKGISQYMMEQMKIDEKRAAHIANAYRLVFHGQDALINVCNQIVQQIPAGEEIDNIITFLSSSKLGLITKI